MAIANDSQLESLDVRQSKVAKRVQRRSAALSGSIDDHAADRFRWPRLPLCQIGDAASDSTTAIHIINVRECRAKLLIEQWKMRTGEYYRIDAVTLWCVEHRLGRCPDRVDADFISGQLRFGELDKFG